MNGIERIKIISEDWEGDYNKFNRAIEPSADLLYPTIFYNIGLPLIDYKVAYIKCSIDEAQARYDWKEGIDIILHFSDGTKATLQEKFLDYYPSTATVETKKTSGKPGAWFYCTAQYFIWFYARKWRLLGDISIQDWLLVDWASLHRIDATSNLPWKTNNNKKYGRRAEFKYLLFDEVPSNCLVARYNYPIKKSQVKIYQPELF
jgi:hypothetical protein